MSENIPTHIAIIMDGNGRWAKERNLPRYFGHQAGVESVREVVRSCAKLGVKYLTLFVFSTENWERPKKEVNALMNLLKKLLKSEAKELNENNVRVKAIGQIERLPEEVRKNLEELIELTKNNTGLTLVLSLSYGGRQEILDGIKKILESKLTPEKLDEKEFRKFLYDPEIPDPDLMIRTGGEYRISNFLLFQSAYTEFYFTKTLWPDFREKDLLLAIEDYKKRKRKFGRISEFE
ncbi:MAG: isoprenyl transferase [candidate division WOR-3 bacterium]|nr:isoprenyl transferase [candidate division WOR-3 bacterium]MDW8113343.1 isoprenyl transferase [candidate division WOR-3 bacterium]